MKCAIVLAFTIATALAAPSDVKGPLEQIALGNELFTSSVYKHILKSTKGSIIFSPFSAETVLALTSEGSKGETRSELISALGLPNSQETIQKGFKELLPKLDINDYSTTLTSANKIYVANGVKLENDFSKVAETIYKSGVEQISFLNSVQASKIINGWVEDKTNKKIKDLIKPEQIDSDTVLALINALYLSAKWENPFPEYATSKDTFFKTLSEKIEVPTMTVTEAFNYEENKELNAQFVQIPFEHDGLSMIIALPNEKDGITALENNVDKVFATRAFTLEPVHIKLPKFSIETQLNVKDILESLGVHKLFDQDADLSGLAVNAKNVYVSEVVQKAFINVTESGVEAAAATAVLVETRSGRYFVRKPKSFFADHPFLYFIKYNDVILFAGKYSS